MPESGLGLHILLSMDSDKPLINIALISVTRFDRKKGLVLPTT